MINWDKTEEKFGYNKSNTKTKNRIVVSCDKCNNEFDRIYNSYNQTVKKSGQFLCHKCATQNKKFKEECSKRAKKLWENEEYKNRNLESVRSEEYRKKKQERSKELWNDLNYVNHQNDIRKSEKFRKSVSNGVIKAWENEEYKDRISEISRKRLINKWRDVEYRKRMIVHQKLNTTNMWAEKYDELMNTFNSAEFINKMKIINNEILSRPEVIDKLSEAGKRNWKDEEYRNKIIDKNIERWLDEEFRKRMTVVRSQQPRVSSIQTVLYSILDDLNVKYYREYKDKPNDPEIVIGYYNFDCVIPRDDKPDLLIECQGDYWHSQDKAIKRDKAKSTYIKKYFPQYELKYLWEHEFSCKEKIVEVIKYWLGITDTELIDFNFKDVDIRSKVKSDEYKLLLSKYHYLPNAGRGGRIYGAYFNNELIAVCVFSSLVRQNIRTGDYSQDECLELSRFCVHPRYQKKNFGSWFVSRCLKLLSDDFKLIISYCDKTFNHDGALYKACNFKDDGVVPPDYWYVDSDGYVMHKRTLYGRAVKMKMRESDFAEQYGYRRVYGDEKIRFVYER